MAVDGADRQLTDQEKKRLAGPPISTAFEPYSRMFLGVDMRIAFDTATADAAELRTMLRQDGNARKGEQVLTLPIRSAAWEIRPAPDGDEYATFIRDMLDDKLGRLIDQMTSAIVYRKAFFELVWDIDAQGRVVLKCVEFRPAASCEAGWDPQTGEPKGFRQRIGNPGGILVVTPRQMRSEAPGYVSIPAERSFIYTHGAWREPIEGVSDLDVCWWAWETRQKIMFLWFQFLEQQSLPKVIAYGDDPTAADRNADAIADANASGVIPMARPSSDPSAKTFEVLASDGSGASQFLDAIKYLEGLATNSILAGFTDLAGAASDGRGSNALSADQSEFFLAARQAVADEIADCVSGLFKRVIAYNHGEEAAAKAPTLEIGPISKIDKGRALAMLNALIIAPQFNAPAGFVDLLITSTASYLGLPVDKVADMVEKHREEADAKAEQMDAQMQQGAVPGAPGAPPQAPDGATPPGAPDAAPAPAQAPAKPAGIDTTKSPADQLKQLINLAHAVDVAHNLVIQADAA